MTTFLDITAEPKRLDPKRFRLNANGVLVTRRPAIVDSVCIHQTACVFGPAANPPKRHRRAAAIPYHALAFTDATVTLAHNVLAYTYHGNAFNKRSVGYGIEGLYPEFDRDFDPKIHTAMETEAFIDAIREGLRRVVETAREAGCPIRYQLAHRQSATKNGKPADPGEKIWKILTAYGRDALGLETLDDLVTNPAGRPIPKEWKL